MLKVGEGTFAALHRITCAAALDASPLFSMASIFIGRITDAVIG